MKPNESSDNTSLADRISPDNARVGGKTVEELLADGTLLPAGSPKRKSVEDAIADLNRRSLSEVPGED